MSNEINQALGLDPMPLTIYEHPKAPAVPADEQAMHDADVARDGLFQALSKSQQAVEDLASLAVQSQSAKAYEALNNAIKTLSDVSMNLAELQIKKQKLEGKNPDAGKTVNNNLIMTTEDVLKMLKGEE